MDHHTSRRDPVNGSRASSRDATLIRGILRDLRRRYLSTPLPYRPPPTCDGVMWIATRVEVRALAICGRLPLNHRDVRYVTAPGQCVRHVIGRVVREIIARELPDVVRYLTARRRSRS